MGPKDKGPKHHNRRGKQRRVNEVELMKTPTMMKLVLLQLFCRHHLIGNDLTSRHRRSDADPETIEISDV